MKLLCIPDLHIYDKNIGHTTNYPKECLGYLSRLENIIRENNITHIVIGGDLRHRKINSAATIAKIIQWFIRLNELTEGNVYGIYGNHDMSGKETYTELDMLKELGLIKIQDYFDICEGVRVYLKSYPKTAVKEEKVKYLSIPKEDGVEKAIGVYHEAIAESMEGLGIIGEVIDPITTHLFDNIDVAIINHIHIPIGKRTLTIGDKDVVVYTPGSIGRTQFHVDKIYDKVYLPLIELAPGKELVTEEIEFILEPIETAFDVLEILQLKKKENAFQEFSQNIENVKINLSSAIDILSNLNIEPEVKQICIELLNEAV